MKANKYGKIWAHISCALWIPEVSIGCVEKMEPITKISRYSISIENRLWKIVILSQFFPFTVYQAVDGISYAFYVRIRVEPVFSVQKKLARLDIT